jgi:hypothetical protein
MLMSFCVPGTHRPAIFLLTVTMIVSPASRAIAVAARCPMVS